MTAWVIFGKVVTLKSLLIIGTFPAITPIAKKGSTFGDTEISPVVGSIDELVKLLFPNVSCNKLNAILALNSFLS